ncbi:MAG TPA: histidine phosphatase family protein [Candidatus Limnocylindrales bacterium]|jgi:phosphohistidine phosphatase|nr:histidine phosphatase family protein [Candidatus Limnocylindrales bacterium]
MLLDLLRHADAGDPEAWDRPDAERPLSEKGRKQAKRLGDHLAAIGFRAEAVITSPKMRAVETAELVADRVDGTVTEDQRLAGSLDLDIIEAILHDAGDPDEAMLVGHDPDFSELLSVLCAAAGVTMRKGALARIEVDRPLRAGGGTLRWLLPPDLLKPAR